MHLAAQLKAKAWDLPALRKLAEGGADATREALDTLKRLSALVPVNVPAVQEAVNRLRACATQVAALHGDHALHIGQLRVDACGHARKGALVAGGEDGVGGWPGDRRRSARATGLRRRSVASRSPWPARH